MERQYYLLQNGKTSQEDWDNNLSEKAEELKTDTETLEIAVFIMSDITKEEIKETQREISSELQNIS